MTALQDKVWHSTQLHEALPALAQAANYWPATEGIHPLSEVDPEPAVFSQWLEVAAQQLGLDICAVESTYADLDNMLTQCAPALLQLPASDTEHGGFLVLLKGNSKHLTVLSPDGSQQTVSRLIVHHRLIAARAAPLKPSIQKMLEHMNIPDHRHQAVLQAILREQLGQARISGCWLLRLSPGDDFRKHVYHSGLLRQTGWMLGGLIIAQLLGLSAWFFIGRSVFQGNFEPVLLDLWALLLFTVIPLQLFSLWIKNRLTLKQGSLFRQRLLHGILQLTPAEVRHQGSGHFLGQVMDIEALEAVALSNGLISILALTELLLAVGILLLGIGGMSHAFLLMLWLGAVLFVNWRYYLMMQCWIVRYRHMTQALIERMIGHRTRLVQEASEQHHVEEDTELGEYLRLSAKLDQHEVLLQSLSGRRGWLLIGLIGLFPFFLQPQPAISLLMLSLGGILMAGLALDRLGSSTRNLLQALVAWRELKPLFKAAERGFTRKPPHFVSPSLLDKQMDTEPLLKAETVHFQYAGAANPVLKQCSLTVQKGDRILLEGPSGGGKSTLAALLAGLHLPQAGHIHLSGFPLELLGESAWRQRVVIAPQFHENHILTETLAFNLLMGHRWPPTTDDLIEAETVCRELKLGDMLDTMPAGLQQMVGEGGWRLSHGERSRVFIARTLLQKADVIILDESFAALDAETLKTALYCVLRRSNALLLIAHP